MIIECPHARTAVSSVHRISTAANIATVIGFVGKSVENCCSDSLDFQGYYLQSYHSATAIAGRAFYIAGGAGQQGLS